MKDIPDQTRSLLSEICRNMPKTPYRGAKAIRNYLINNHTYGSDENIIQKKWRRYPHEIKNSMNCNDAGIYTFLMSRELGLDSSLVRFENFDKSGQSHLDTIIRGNNSDYIVSLGRFDKIKLFDKYVMSNDKVKETFDNVEILDVPDVVESINYSKKNITIKDFLKDGKILSSYFGKDNSLSPIHYYNVSRSLIIENDELMVRKTFNIPGMYVHCEHYKDRTVALISSGINNIVLTNPHKIFTIDKNNNNKSTIHTGDLSDNKKLMIHRGLIRSAKANVFSFTHIDNNGYKGMKIPRYSKISKSQEKLLIGLRKADIYLQDKETRKILKKFKMKWPYPVEKLEVSLEYYIHVLQNNDKDTKRGNNSRKIITRAERMVNYQNRLERSQK